MLAGADDGGDVHACVSPMSSSCADVDTSSSNSMSYISLFKKTIVVMGPTDISRPVATVVQ
jgi:hypothetical protein